MFAAVLVLAATLAITFKIDYRTLAAEGSKKQWVVYVTIFGVGFIMVAVYIFNPSFPTN